RYYHIASRNDTDSLLPFAVARVVDLPFLGFHLVRGLFFGTGQRSDFVGIQGSAIYAKLVDDTGEVPRSCFFRLDHKAFGTQGTQVRGDGPSGMFALAASLRDGIEEQFHRPVGMTK